MREMSLARQTQGFSSQSGQKKTTHFLTQFCDLKSENCIRKLKKYNFCWMVSKYYDVLASLPVTIWFNTVNKQNLLGFDGFSLTLSPSSDRHFQTNKAIDLGLVLFWSSLVVLCVMTKKSFMEASSGHIFMQTFTSTSISPIFFFHLSFEYPMKMTKRKNWHFLRVIFIERASFWDQSQLSSSICLGMTLDWSYLVPKLLQLNLWITDINGPTNFIYYWRIFIIANIRNKEKWFEGTIV